MHNFIGRIISRFGLNRSIIIIFGLLFLILLITISYVAYKKMEQLMIKETLSNSLASISQMNHNLDYTLSTYESLLNNIVVNFDLKENLLRDANDVYEAYMIREDILNTIKPITNVNDNLLKIEIIQNQNPLLADNNIFPSIDGKEDWFNDFLKKQPFYTAWTFYNGKFFPFVGDKDVVQLEKKITNFQTKQTLGIVRLMIDMKPIKSIVSAFSPVPGSIFYLFDANQEVLFTNNLCEGINPVVKQYMQAATAEKGAFFVKLDESKMLFHYNRDNRANLAIVVILPASINPSVIKDLRNFIILFTFIVLVVGLFLEYFFSNLITRRFRGLIQKINNVSSGNLEVISDGKSYDREEDGERYYRDEIGYLDYKFDVMVKKINELIQDRYEVQVKQKEVELKTLQAQINPHFLYNTLSSINWMAVDIDAHEISDAINALAKYYRLTLNKGRDMIAIYDELEQLKAYVSIQQIRFRDKFDVVYHVDPTVMMFLTPKIVLQPFVENAILHGFKQINYKGFLTVAVYEREHNIELTVEDNGVGFDPKQLNHLSEHNGGYGIKNVEEKIYLTYGGQGKIELKSGPGQGTKVIITISKLNERQVDNHAETDHRR